MKAVKFFKLCMTAVAIFVFASCDGVDARDAFVGRYNLVSEGEVRVYNTIYEDLYIMTVPFGAYGKLSITKMKEKDKVTLTVDNYSVNATVSGNELIIEPFVENAIINGDSLVYTFSESKGTLINNILRWKTEVTVELSYLSMEGPLKAIGTDTMSVVAAK